MGYHILYSPEKRNKYPQNTPKKSNRKALVTCLAVGAVIVSVVWTSKMVQIGEVLLPGDYDHFRQAVKCMVEQIRLGTPITEAIEAFCVEIVGYGLQAT